jgi:copper chaperone
MFKTNTIVIFALFSFFLGCGKSTQETEVSTKTEFSQLEEASLETVTLDVKGMTCNGCVQTISKNMAKTEGVNKCEVSLAENSASVTFDPSKTTKEKIAQTISDLGYQATLVNN